MTAPDLEPNPLTMPKRSGIQRILKWLAILVGLVVALVLCVALLLTFWFPSELVREELEVRLSDMLDGTVRIRALSFNLLSGLSLEEVEFQQVEGEQPILQLDRLVLDYSLLGLLQQKLKINEVRIDGADLSLNLAELERDSSEFEPEPAPPSSGSSDFLPIPLALELETLVISRTNIEVEISSDLAVRLRDLNLEVSGGVAKNVVRLEGELSVAQIGVDLEEQQLRIPLGLAFDVTADLSSQHLGIDHVTLTSEPALSVTLSGTVEHFLGTPSVDLSLEDARLDLERMLALVNDFVPPEFRNQKISGILLPALFVKGELGEKGLTGLVNTRLIIRGFQADLPQFESRLDPTIVEVHLTDVGIKDNLPEAGTVEVHVQSKKASFQAYAVDALDIQLAGDYFTVGPVSGNMNMSGTVHLPPQEPIEALTLPFAIRFDALGNHRTQEATIKQLVVELGDLLNVHIEGLVTPNPGPPQTVSVDLKTRIEPHLEHLLPLVPQNVLKDLAIEKLPSADFITVDVQGKLDAEYRPLDVDLSARVKLGNMTLQQGGLSAAGTLSKMNLSVATEYNALKEVIRGSVTGTVNLEGLEYAGMASVGQVDLAMDTSFSGRLSPAFKPSKLKSKQTINLLMKNIQYTSPTLGMSLDELTLSAKLHEMIDDQHFTVDALRMTSESLMDVQLAADFQQKSQDFDVSVEIPYVNIGELQRRLSGEAVKNLHALHPRGDIALTLKASGRVPQEKEIQTLDIPVTFTTKVSLKDVHGGLADYQVNGAEGSVSLSFTPGDSPVAKVESDLTFAEVLLGPGFPLEQLSGTFAQVNLVVKNFNEVAVKTLHVGMNGADVSMAGTIGGLRKVVEGESNVMAVLPDMFSQVTTNVQVRLDEFKKVLEPSGISATGQAQVELSLLKKERGPLALTLKLGSRGMQLSQNGTHIKNMDGQINIRKRLDWIDQVGVKSRSGVFRPSDVLSQLRSINGKEKSLSIDRLDLGFLTVSNFSANVLFDQDVFQIQNLAMNLLDGGLGGNLMLTGGKAFGVAGRFEAAHLDLNQLLDEKQKISGDSLVDATIGVSVFFEEATGALDLSRTELKLFITHIGREAVDRLLVFLDPEGSNPTLVTARSQIKLANPSNVSLQLARGMLSLEILFSEGLLQPFRLNRIPISKMKAFKAVTEGISSWEQVRELMAMVGAKSYGLDSQGKLILQ
jgi:AsmA family